MRVCFLHCCMLLRSIFVLYLYYKSMTFFAAFFDQVNHTLYVYSKIFEQKIGKIKIVWRKIVCIDTKHIKNIVCNRNTV